MDIPAVEEECNLDSYDVAAMEWEEYDPYNTENLAENRIVEPPLKQLLNLQQYNLARQDFSLINSSPVPLMQERTTLNTESASKKKKPATVRGP